MEEEFKKEALLRLANKVKAVRTGLKITQEQANIDTKIHFGRVEQGKRDISYTTLLKICDYFKMSPEEFMKGL